MINRNVSGFFRLSAVCAALLCSATSVSAQIVRAVMFYSPTCPHCEQVISQDLPVFFGIYGGDPQAYTDEAVPQNQRYAFLFSNGQLEILLINASLRAGSQLFEASFGSHGRPSGVPRMIVEEDVLVGSIEIPNRMHDLIKAGLAKGGVDWPSIPGLLDAISGIPQAAPFAVVAQASPVSPDSTVPAAQPADTLQAAPDTQMLPTPEPAVPALQPRPAAEPDSSSSGTADASAADTAGTGAGVARPTDSMPATQTTLESVASHRPTMLQNFSHDPVGNGLSVLVLIGMVVSLLLISRYAKPTGQELQPGIVVPLLSLLGIAVAAYLTYIEVGQVTAVCGPVGDCNTVNQSEYARLFGLIPVGALGLVGYVALIATWLGGRYASPPLSDRSTVALFAGALFGTLLSVYLTFLEPFVIGATCAWCLTSAVIITVLMWLSARPAAQAWAVLRRAGNRERGTVEPPHTTT